MPCNAKVLCLRVLALAEVDLPQIANKMPIVICLRKQETIAFGRLWV